MHTQCSVSANDVSSMLLWNQFKLIAHLPARTTIQIQRATRVSVSLWAWRRGLQKIRLWYEQKHPLCSVSTRSAPVQSEGTRDRSDVILLLSTWLTLLMSLASNFQQAER
jgi:hypothetical protein